MATNSLSAASFDFASDSPPIVLAEVAVAAAISGRVPFVLGQRAKRGDAMERPPRWGERSSSSAEVWSGRGARYGGEAPGALDDVAVA